MEIEKIIASAAISLGLIYGVYRNLTGGDKSGGHVKELNKSIDEMEKEAKKWLPDDSPPLPRFESSDFKGSPKKRNKDGNLDKRFKENK